MERDDALEASWKLDSASRARRRRRTDEIAGGRNEGARRESAFAETAPHLAAGKADRGGGSRTVSFLGAPPDVNEVERRTI